MTPRTCFSECFLCYTTAIQSQGGPLLKNTFVLGLLAMMLVLALAPSSFAAATLNTATRTILPAHNFLVGKGFETIQITTSELSYLTTRRIRIETLRDVAILQTVVRQTRLPTADIAPRAIQPVTNKTTLTMGTNRRLGTRNQVPINQFLIRGTLKLP